MNYFTSGATFLALLMLAAGDATAQRPARGTRVGVSVGISAVSSRARYVGTSNAAHLQVAVARALGSRVSAAVLFDAFLQETMESIPPCVPLPAVVCEARTEVPGAVIGGTVEGRYAPFGDGLALTGGVGTYAAPGARGPVNRSSTVLSFGADYARDGASRWLPVASVRFTHLVSDLAGVRWILSPTVGLRF